MQRRNPTTNHRLPRGTVVKAVDRRPRLDIAIPVLLGALFMVGLLVFAFVRDAGAGELDPATGGLTVTHLEFTGGGSAYLAGTNNTANTYTAATFHVPNYANPLDGQTMTDSRLVPPGPFDLELLCEPGAAQVDLYLDDQLIGADITADCGGVTPVAATTTTTTTVAPPAPPVVAGGSEQAGETATISGLTPPVAVSSGQEGAGSVVLGSTPAPPLVPAPPSVGVLAAPTVTRHLAYTGANWWTPALVLMSGACFMVGALLARVGRRHMAKEQQP